VTQPGRVLRAGDAGDAIRDLQHRLIGAGHTIAPSELGGFGPGTERAVRDFQTARRIRVDGLVGPETWSALVESGFVLGDRLLYLRRPNLRGDDVVALQRTLNRLGFDAGREDGILGPATDAALRDFQRNAGLSLDGVAGPATLAAFRRVERMADGSVAAVRERDALRRPEGIEHRRIYLAIDLGYDQVGTALRRGLDAAGAQVMHDVSGSDDHALAARANRWTADLFLAIRGSVEPGWEIAAFETPTFRSERGHHTARALAESLATVYPEPRVNLVGRAYTALRETRMAAVICSIGDAGTAVSADADAVARSLGAGVRRSFTEPAAEPTDR
jgi:N-acetylmuramoyl-L-alanine amidase